jgi:polyferredoxin
VLYLLAAAVLTPPLLVWGGRLPRRAWLAFHLAVGGILLGVQFSSVQILSLLRLELPVFAWPGFLALGVLLSSAVWGPVYCGYLCPAGALQEALSWVGGALGTTRRLSEARVKWLALARQAVLAVVVVGALGFGLSRVEDLDLLRFLWAPRKPLTVVVLLALVGFGSLISPRFGCRGLCPAGAFLGLANRFAPLRLRLPAKRYAACDLGVLGAADAGCVQCYRCLREVPVPPGSAIHSRAAGLVLAAALALLVWSGLPSLASGGRTSGLVRVEAVDEGVVRRKMEAGSLSDHPALYWRPAFP